MEILRKSILYSSFIKKSYKKRKEIIVNLNSQTLINCRKVYNKIRHSSRSIIFRTLEFFIFGNSLKKWIIVFSSNVNIGVQKMDTFLNSSIWKGSVGTSGTKFYVNVSGLHIKIEKKVIWIGITKEAEMISDRGKSFFGKRMFKVFGIK